MSDYSSTTRYLVGCDEEDARGGSPTDLERAYRIAETIRANKGVAEIYEVQMIVDFETMKLTDRSVREEKEPAPMPAPQPLYNFAKPDVLPFGDSTIAIYNTQTGFTVLYTHVDLADDILDKLNAGV